LTVTAASPLLRAGDPLQRGKSSGEKKAERGVTMSATSDPTIFRRSADDDADGKLRDVSALDEGAERDDEAAGAAEQLRQEAGRGFLFLGHRLGHGRRGTTKVTVTFVGARMMGIVDQEFPETRWSQLLELRDPSHPRYAEHLEQLRSGTTDPSIPTRRR